MRSEPSLAANYEEKMNSGILMVIASSVIFGVTPTIFKSVLLKDTPPILGIVYYSVIGLILNWVISRIKKNSLSLPKAVLLRLALIGILGNGFTSLLLSSAYNYIPVGFATAIHFIYPIVVAVAISIIFKEPFGEGKSIASVCSFLGMFLIIKLDHSGSTTGFLLAISSSFTFAFYIIANSHMDLGNASVIAKMFWVYLFSGIFFTAGAFIFRHKFTLPDLSSYFTILLCGCLIFLAHTLFMTGITSIGASSAAFTSMMEPIASLITSSVIYPENRVTLVNLFGVALILFSMLLSTASLKAGEEQAPQAKTIA